MEEALHKRFQQMHYHTLVTDNQKNGRLYFDSEAGQLYLLDKLAHLLLEGLNAGLTAQALCQHLADPEPDCLERLSTLKEHWWNIGLLVGAKDEATPDAYLYVINLLATKEPVTVKTTIKAVHEHLQKTHPLYTGDDTPDSVITVSEQTQNDREAIQILVNGQPKHFCQTLDEALISCAYEIGELATHEFPRMLVAHAAAVCSEQQVILMPAVAGSGKSTLSTALLQQGYHIINDDIVPVNFNGTLTAINSPVKIKSGSWPVLGALYPELMQADVVQRADQLKMRQWLPPEEMRCLPGSTYQATAIVVPEYNPDKAASITSLNPTQSLQALLQAEPYFPHRLTRPYLKAILNWLEPIPAWRMNYQTIDQAIDMLDSISLIK